MLTISLKKTPTCILHTNGGGGDELTRSFYGSQFSIILAKSPVCFTLQPLHSLSSPAHNHTAAPPKSDLVVPAPLTVEVSHSTSSHLEQASITLTGQPYTYKNIQHKINMSWCPGFYS